MRVTYYALRDVRVGDEVRQCGDLVPEAMLWPYLTGYLSDGKIAPVLVATLPEEQQIMLLDWESEVMGVTDEGPAAEQESDQTEDDEEPVVVPDDFDPSTADKRTKEYKAWAAQQEQEVTRG